MEVRVTSDPQSFGKTVFPFLQSDPVLHTIIMSNVHERANGSAQAENEPSYFVSVHDPDMIGAATRTPGRGVNLGALRAELAQPVAEAYADVLPELRNVNATEGRGTRLHKLIEHTPPEHRRRGYGGALTSHVTVRILAEGNYACLYTDLANPTANKLYHQAGYRPVADFVDVDFT
ncbi:GNAT family N-acetyltransferase [Kribbella sp. NPDC048928]|uniref:GNAT family N-acetyltransferase n=1 Tax=Kribbella sp. NPDC048928 TaxID=3364111 RepID=UPI0037192F6A